MNIKLSHKNIIDKEFEVEYKGYKVEEVDGFLDAIAEDYATIEINNKENLKMISTLEEELERVKDELSLARTKNSELEKTISEQIKDKQMNSDIFRRVSMLEKKTSEKDK
ncbi:cell cycle protein GpsB [Spiroplasma sp. TIUS-1]|uniref:DivIVA domain-containing protein n=1 Tax=Spiroplasma sp. TIUS-1 TaxID=216963 RepID=UPI001396D385|nr:DivIVA domain-containing protein [Spiroplasma sp. TIUS-1]QHX36008.1 cell cycle protein GpsB [Spiroplasma sp. TIUS-1]